MAAASPYRPYLFRTRTAHRSDRAGWMQYYGAFYRSAMCQLLSRINAYLVRWIRKKYKRLRAEKKAIECWRGITERHPRLFAHWIWVPSVARVW